MTSKTELQKEIDKVRELVSDYRRCTQDDYYYMFARSDNRRPRFLFRKTIGKITLRIL